MKKLPPKPRLVRPQRLRQVGAADNASVQPSHGGGASLLCERLRSQWRFGAWELLTRVSPASLADDPDRAELAALVGSAWLQRGDALLARQLLRRARQWGLPAARLDVLLGAGVCDALARAAQALGNQALARECFERAVTGCGGDPRLLWQVRAAGAQCDWHGETALRDTLGGRERQFPELPQGDDSAPAFKQPGRGIVSHAQNFEDVILWRALGGMVAKGFYIDIGAQDPIVDSVSLAFYERGWRGIHVEPVPAYAAKLRQNRPDETVIEAAIAERAGERSLFVFAETGLSTGEAAIAERHRATGKFEAQQVVVQGLPLAHVLRQAGDREIHWLKIDVEGMEQEVLTSWGDQMARPWIVVVESTLPSSQIENFQQWEPQLERRGYHYVYFDGLNRYYLSERRLHLAPAFRNGPSCFDYFKLAPGHNYSSTKVARTGGGEKPVV